ncbi:zinc ribbon domain-containing protein [Natronorubrum sp. A-ect3]|uniref:zinc ribbon domain-containing protein n=1 Tax=Natronorubrum sp. A-ect3 TaxID=3242698 RepID=UPI00359D86E9
MGSPAQEPNSSEKYLSGENDTEEETIEGEEDGSVPSEESTYSGPESKQKAADEQFCSSCGEIIKREASICPNCGVSQGGNANNNPGLAAILSGAGFVVPIAAGAGQIYNENVGKGVAFCLIQAIHIMVVVFLWWTIIPLLTYPAVQAYATYDAYKGAQ